MSRHRLTPQAGYEGYEITIGWDRALGSFYAQMVARNTAATTAEQPHVWLGADTPVTDAATVVEALRPYAQIPAHLHAQLKADAAREGSRHHDRTIAAPPGLRAVLDQLRTAVHAGNAEAAVTLLREMTLAGYSPVVAQVIESTIDWKLLHLSHRQLTEAYGVGHTLYGLTIASSVGLYLAIATPKRTIHAFCSEGIHPRSVLAAIGLGPDRYTYRSYGSDDSAELFSLSPVAVVP